MFCHKCGNELPDGSKFCPSCGAQQISQNLQQDHNNQSGKRTSHLTVKIIIGTVMSVVISIISIIAVFFPNLLNFEKQKFGEIEMEIKEPKDAKKLYDFLMQNDKKIIKMKLSYFPQRYLNGDYTRNKNEKYGLMYVECPSENNDSYETCSYEYLNKTNKNFTNNKMFFTVDPHLEFFDASSGAELYNLTPISGGPGPIGAWGFKDGGYVPFKLWGWCNVNDIPCQLTRQDYAKFPLAGLIFDNQLAPGVVFDEDANAGYDEEDIRVHLYNSKKRTLTDEVVLYGDNYNFSANHRNLKYIDNIEYVDSGSLSFVINNTNESVPVYLVHRDFLRIGDDWDNNEETCDPILPMHPEFINKRLPSKQEFAAKYITTKIGDDECEYVKTSALNVQNNKIIFTDDSTKDVTNIFKKSVFSYYYADSEKKPEISDIYENSFQIQINKTSDDNSVYTWNSSNLSTNFPKYKEQIPLYGETNVKMELAGYFLVKFKNQTDVNNFPEQYCYLQDFFAEVGAMRDGFVSKCQAQVFELDPLSIKDVEQANYK